MKIETPTPISLDPQAQDSAGPTRIDWRVVTLAAVAVGAALRLAQYFSRQSYWTDEASLLLNVFGNTASQLLGPLEYDQAAPPLFLLALRAAHVLMGRGELAMRLLPLLLGLGALGLFALLARRVLAPFVAAMVVALFALSNHLITHAAEAKQYAGDAFVAVMMLLAAIGGAPGLPAWRRLERVSLLACVAFWFSHPAAFMFGGIALALVIGAIREKPTRLARIAGAFILPLVSFLILYFVSIRHQQSQVLSEYWAAKFVDFSVKLPLWLLRALNSLFNYSYELGGSVLLGLGVVGALELWKSGRRQWLGILVLPMLLTLLAAALRRYPFWGTRLTLFLAPGCLLLAGHGLQALQRPMLQRLGGWWYSAIAALIGIGAAISVYHLAIPRYRGNMRPVVQHIREHRRPDESVFAERALEFLAYWPDPDQRVVLGDWPQRFPTQERFWAAVSFGSGRGDLRRQFPFDRQGAGEPTARQHWRGGAALLYDRTGNSTTSPARD